MNSQNNSNQESKLLNLTTGRKKFDLLKDSNAKIGVDTSRLNVYSVNLIK